MINALRDKTSYVHVQLYNSSPITGLDGTSYNMGTKEGIVAMCEMLLKGFHVGAYYTNSTDESTYFAPLRPDQVVIGVPSSQSAAGSGQVTNEVLQSAFTELNNNYPGIRGIMSWSINWDSSQNKNTFVNENAEFLAKFKNNEPTTVAPVTTVAPTEKTTTVAPTTVAPTEKATTAVPTTQAPTTVAPTEKATTAVPTTVAPTEKATTVAPTTVAPTTKIDEDDTIPAPIGLTYAGNKDLPYYFAWQAPSSDIENYNVYVDGVFAGSSVNSSINLTADVFANGNGDYTVSVRSVKNGKMSAATQITYTFKDGTGSKPTTVAPVTTVAPTEKATTAVPTTQTPTTQAPTTTAAPTEKATTAVPTTQAPTTVAPTEKATTVAPTTVAPTTKIDEDDTIPAPIGLTYAGNKDLPYYFAWQAPSSDIENYNVYVDGVFAGSSVNSSINLTADVFANGNGDYTVSVRSVKNGKMSAATQITYTFKDGTGSKPTTVAPVTTVAPTEKTTTVAPVTTQAPTEKATTAVPTTQTPTTVAPTEKTTTAVPTTQAPTTAAPTEKATTAVPTTVAPTTVAPTEKATTVVPTTQTPTTIAPSETGTTTKPETSKETPTVSTTEIVTTKTAQTVKVPKVKIKKATKKRSAKKLKVTLKTAKGVKGYQVMISTSKKFKKAKVKNYKKAKFTIKKLKANKKYFIRVRAYKVVNGEVYYGKWSNRKVKLKK